MRSGGLLSQAVSRPWDDAMWRINELDTAACSKLTFFVIYQEPRVMISSFLDMM
jgi:hypothetical protein